MTVCLALATMALAMAAPDIYVLETHLDVWDLSVEDINGNGHKDLVAITYDDKEDPDTKHLVAFLQQDDGSYRSRPDVRMALDPAYGALFWAQVGEHPVRSLVAVSSTRATVMRLHEGQFVVTGRTEFNSLVPEGARRLRFLPHAAQDLTGDGIDEWLIPMPTGYAARNLDGLVAKIPVNVFSEARGGDRGGLQVRYGYPSHQVFEPPDTDSKSIVFLTDEYADFVYGEDWSQQRRFPIPAVQDDQWSADVQLRDINANGLPDLIVTQTAGSVNITVVTRVYLATDPYEYPDEPDATFETEGAFATPVIIDVDGDGQLDIAQLKVPYSVGSFVNYFLRRRLTVQAEVYLFKDGSFSTSPDFSTSFPIDAPDGRRSVAYTIGDFNGNGRADVAFGASGDELVVHTGDPNDFLSRRPWQTLNIPSFGRAEAHDLRNDGKDELIIYHPDTELAKKIHVVAFP